MTRSNLNGFSKFFHRWKEKEISNKCRKKISTRLTYVATLLWEIDKSKLTLIYGDKL